MMLQSPTHDRLNRSDSSYYHNEVTLTVKVIEVKLVKIWPDFTCIDLSFNGFEGEIPNAIGNITSLYLLNLSHNSLTDAIPRSLGALTELGSLDLSSNKLTGRIPDELTTLGFLSVLNLSYNHLTGPIPTGHQFQTFSADSFVGNAGLSGFTTEVSTTLIHLSHRHQMIRNRKMKRLSGNMCLLLLVTLWTSPHMNIRRRGAPSYVPLQIWEMQELKHIEILGKSLAAPSNIAQLGMLSTLVGVNASICTITELFKRIPNIQKLGIEIEQTPYDDHNDLLSFFRCISTLKSLKTLKFSITNPVVRHGHVFFR